MINKILEIKYSDEKALLTIKGELNKIPDSVRIVVRRVIEDKKLVTIEPFYYKCDFEENIFLCNIDLNKIVNEITVYEKQILDIFLEIDKEEHEVKVNKEEFTLNAKYNLIQQEPLYKFKPYINGRNTLSIFINNIDIQANLKNYNIKDDIIKGQIELKLNEYKNIELDKNFSYKLIIKKRLQENLFEYGFEYKNNLEIVGADILSICNFDLSKLSINNNKQDGIYWDLFIEIHKDKKKLTIPITKALVNEYLTNDGENVRFNVIINKNNGVSLKANPKKIIVSANNIQQYEDGFKIDINIQNIKDDDYDDIRFVCKKRMKIGDSIEYYDIYEENLTKNNEFEINYSFYDVTPIHQIRENDVYDLFIRFIIKTNDVIDIPIQVSKESSEVKNDYISISKNNKTYKVKLYVNGKMGLSIFAIYNNIKRENTIKIAVFGSCFSRAPFTSTSFFNPQYKKQYTIVETDFHSSIISAVSKPSQIDLEKINNLKDIYIKYISYDFEKSTFDRLKEAKPDYIILDFYADAVREVIYLDEDRCVSGSPKLRCTKYYKELKNIKILDHTNNEQYFNVWCIAIEEFMKRLKKIVPEERVILNKSNFVYSYKDKDNTIKKFSEPDKIKRNMYFFDKLNNYFIHKYPNCPVVDMTNHNYIGTHNHPLGNTYSHYETDYYKLFMEQLTKVIFIDRLDNK